MTPTAKPSAPLPPATRRSFLSAASLGTASLGTASLLGLSACEGTMRAGHDPRPAPDVAEPALATPIGRWLVVADRLCGDPNAAWPRADSIALVTRAMHDGLNAAQPRYHRWLPRNGTEPASNGASPSVTLAAAAFTVVTGRSNPAAHGDARALLDATLAAEPAEAARTAGLALGAAIGTATLASAGPRPPAKETFPVFNEMGRWRPAPPAGRNSYYDLSAPLLFPSRDSLLGPPPPTLDSPEYLADVAETRRLGGTTSTDRTEEQGDISRFWVPQLIPRNMMLVLLRRMTARPLPGGVWDEARMASILATAFADADVFVYGYKAHFAYWRPVTGINLGSPGVRPDPIWQPLLVTPYHPEYPSGHSADIATGTHVIAGLLGEFPFTYQALERQGRPTRDFPSLAAARTECSNSRIWCGAHFRHACNEGERIGQAIATKALAQVQRIA
ncbi:phosphatase PAP2 family protein [Roseomonas sp. KE2513]|uniref:vanadium-dependent haloperoxidase n=1 Tax=Roseomonas sp. KE2513 TaxID=2479202 RepID=UPI0018DF0171|nr:vanadium-dependent haloperoxidase [Roseomonas sp. KE2513]MBI0535357.1 phosphatase PAP2 family protein [Roseomonas sp. KE2513]